MFQEKSDNAQVKVKVNVDNLAKNVQLYKAKTAQLKSWLQYCNIRFHPKSSHQDLSALVYEHFKKQN